MGYHGVPGRRKGLDGVCSQQGQGYRGRVREGLRAWTLHPASQILGRHVTAPSRSLASLSGFVYVSVFVLSSVFIIFQCPVQWAHQVGAQLMLVKP